MLNELRFAFGSLRKNPRVTAVATAGSHVPAVRAGQVDPMEALQYE